MGKDDMIMLIFVCSLSAFAIGMILGQSIRANEDKKLAIEAGVAKYIGNEKTGESTFTFITNPTK